MSNILLKQGLTAQQLAIVQSEYDKRKKSKWAAFFLWWFLCAFGAQRFYTGDIGRAVCMILFGWATLFIWNLVDIFFVLGRIDQLNERAELEIISRVKAAGQ